MLNNHYLRAWFLFLPAWVICLLATLRAPSLQQSWKLTGRLWQTNFRLSQFHVLCINGCLRNLSTLPGQSCWLELVRCNSRSFVRMTLRGGESSKLCVEFARSIQPVRILGVGREACAISGNRGNNGLMQENGGFCPCGLVSHGSKAFAGLRFNHFWLDHRSVSFAPRPGSLRPKAPLQIPCFMSWSREDDSKQCLGVHLFVWILSWACFCRFILGIRNAGSFVDNQYEPYFIIGVFGVVVLVA